MARSEGGKDGTGWIDKSLRFLGSVEGLTLFIENLYKMNDETYFSDKRSRELFFVSRISEEAKMAALTTCLVDFSNS